MTHAQQHGGEDMTEAESNSEEIARLKAELADAETKIARARRRDALARQAANIGYWDFTPETGNLQWSPEVLPLLSGLPSGEIETTYENFAKFVHPDDVEESNRIVFEAVESRQPFAIEYRVIHDDGSLHWIRGWGGTVEDEAGQQRMIGAVMDITEMRQIQAQLVQSSKMATLGEMAAGVAHELNQPLNVIRMATDNLRRKNDNGALTPDLLLAKLDKINAQIDRAGSIIDHMRIFGRKPSNQTTLLCPLEMVKSAQDLMGEQLRLDGIDVTVDAPDAVPAIDGHQVLVEQVLLNLLGNARDALRASDGEQKAINVRLRPTDTQVVIEMEDNGGGIDESALPHVFEPFFTTKDVGDGTGLGLSISYGIIRDMHGTLQAHNAENGACFTITLPSANVAD